MPKPKKPPPPDQPMYRDKEGRARFRDNGVVRYLLDNSRVDMNHMPFNLFKQKDVDQFYQLIGYDACGYSELVDSGMVSEEAGARAEEAEEALEE